MTDEAIVKLNPDAIVTTDGVKAKAVENAMAGAKSML